MARWWELRGAGKSGGGRGRGESRGAQDWFALLERGGSEALETIEAEHALRVSAVQACVRLLSEGVAALPLHLYKRLRGGGKEPADGHPAARVLRRPNPRMTAVDLRRVLVANRLLYGNSYAPLVYDTGGRLAAIEVVEPWRVQVLRTDGGLLYRWRDLTGAPWELPGSRLLHFRGLSGNGLVGYSVIGALMHDQMALAYAQQLQARKFIANGSRLSGVVTTSTQMTKEAMERLRASWQATFGGARNAGGTAVLDNGASYQSISMSPGEAQFLESRRFSVEDIARCFGVPPHLIGAQAATSYASSEQHSLEFVTYTLLPLARQLEATLSATLLGEQEQEQLFFEHNLTGLLRGDAKSRFEAYAIGVQNGWISRNEVRGLENLNPVAGLDEYLAPLNMTTAAGLEAAAEELIAGGEAPAQGGPTAPAPAPTPTPRGRRWTGVELRALAGMVEPVWGEEHAHGGEREARSEKREDGAGGDDGEEEGDAWQSPGQRTVRRERQELARELMELWQDAAERLVRRECADLRRQLARGGGAEELAAWLAGFYEELAPAVPKYFRAALRTTVRQAARSVERELGESLVMAELADYVEEQLAALAAAWCGSSEGQLAALLADAGADGAVVQGWEALETRVGEWEEKRAEKAGRRYAVDGVAGGVMAAFALAGVAASVWLASGSSCPACRSLNRRRVALGGAFAEGSVSAGGQTVQIYGMKRRPPLHDGCDCMIGAG